MQVPVGDTSVLQKPAPVRMHPRQLTENFLEARHTDPRIGQFKPLAEMMPQDITSSRQFDRLQELQSNHSRSKTRSLKNIAGPQDATCPMVHPNI